MDGVGVLPSPATTAGDGRSQSSLPPLDPPPSSSGAGVGYPAVTSSAEPHARSGDLVRRRSESEVQELLSRHGWVLYEGEWDHLEVFEDGSSDADDTDQGVLFVSGAAA